MPIFSNIDAGAIMDTSERNPVYVLTSKNGRHIRLSATTYQLLTSVRSGVTFQDLSGTLSQQLQRVVTSEEIEHAYQQIIQRIETIDTRPEQLRALWLKFPLLNEAIVIKIAGILAVAYQPVVAMTLVSLILIGLVGLGLQQGFLASNISNLELWLKVFALYTVSVILHEFGHASACLYYGARPGVIGFGVNLVHPVFYSDVSSAWQLKRWQRVVVDTGGIFFQLIVVACYAGGFLLSGWAPFRFAILLIIYSCLFSLNPLLKYDGYWVIADTLGVTNLNSQVLHIFSWILARLRHKPTKPLPWTNRVLVAIVIYSFAIMVVWGIFIIRIIPMLSRQLNNYPNLLISLARNLFVSPHIITFQQISGLIVPTILIVTLLKWGIFFIQPVLKSLMRLMTSLISPKL